METVEISSTVFAIYESPFYNTPKLAEINVDPDNLFYMSEDGVLYQKSDLDYSTAELVPYKVLICYPPAKTDLEYRIPDDVVKIEGEAFGFYASNLRTLYIPSKITEAFYAIHNTSLENIIVDPGNPSFYSQNGVLYYRSDYNYSSDPYETVYLYKYPSQKKDTYYKVPDEVTDLFDNALETPSAYPTGIVAIFLLPFALYVYE